MASHCGTFSPSARHSRVWPAHRRAGGRGWPCASGLKLSESPPRA
ncbi:Uncharacterised protein [Bordetella pertussis]|nr:Uncharacterised protein [Bordetella pertussis]